MGDRTVPFDEDEPCDCCGVRGSFDFMGDHICPNCLKDDKSEDNYVPEEKLYTYKITVKDNKAGSTSTHTVKAASEDEALDELKETVPWNVVLDVSNEGGPDIRLFVQIGDTVGSSHILDIGQDGVVLKGAAGITYMTWDELSKLDVYREKHPIW